MSAYLRVCVCLNRSVCMYLSVQASDEVWSFRTPRSGGFPGGPEGKTLLS